MNDNPYRKQPPYAFWRRSVENIHPLDIQDWYRKKFSLEKARIATAGSCFAQHVGRALRDNGFHYLDVEPAPGLLPRECWPEYGYGLYSARYGNVYTSRQLLQLAQRALGEFQPKEAVWESGAGYVDPFRPTIEPQPFGSPDEVLTHQKWHLARVAELFEQTDVFVFTLGLTEAWCSKADGAVFPVVPGASGGQFDPDVHAFLNLRFPDVRRDMEDFFARMRSINPDMHFLLTVSPVPLMATATDQNVIVATMYSKSILRAVAGFFADRYPYVDYFPSYEIISAHVMRGQFYCPDMRNVSHHGVEHVMRQLLKEHPAPGRSAGRPGNKPALSPEMDEDDVVCDEELLAVFGEAEK